jgi:hypothetical protein
MRASAPRSVKQIVLSIFLLVIPAGSAGIQTARTRSCEFRKALFDIYLAIFGNWIPAIHAGMTAPSYGMPPATKPATMRA